ncbi:hypothetical protein Gotur_002212 [Gossypium turneri]
MALESSILSKPNFFSSAKSSAFLLFNRNFKYPPKFLSKTSHYPASIISSFPNPRVVKAFGVPKTGTFGSQARLGSLIEENEELGSYQNLIFVKRGILVAMICGVLAFGCKRVFAVEGVVNAGYGVIGQSILLLKNAWPKLSMLLKVFKEQGLVLTALLGLSAFFSMAETAITTLWPWKVLISLLGFIFVECIFLVVQ